MDDERLEAVAYPLLDRREGETGVWDVIKVYRRRYDQQQIAERFQELHTLRRRELKDFAILSHLSN